MSKIIQEACLAVARTNMWDTRPVDAQPIIEYSREMERVALERLELFDFLGAEEQDIADAIRYIEQVYALPPIGNDIRWFDDTLFALLDLAFPNGSVKGPAVRFAKKIISGVKEQIE